MSKKHKQQLTISGAQLLDALTLITGDSKRRHLGGDEEETEITIEHMKAWRDKEDGPQPAGLYAYLTEYPEEGLYGPLGVKVNAELSSGGARDL
jgi:hypothetical protein